MTIDRYITRTSGDIRDMIRVSSREDGFVVFAGYGGGFQYRILEQEFDLAFRPVDDDEFILMSSSFQPMLAGADWIGEDVADAIPAWTNGSVWNGWAMPAFTKQTLLSDRVQNHFRSDYNWTVYIEDLGGFLLLANNDGHRLSDSTDLASVIEQLRASENGYLSEVIVEDHVFEATLHRGRSIMTSTGEEITVYDVGSGSWCWENWSDRALESEPTSPSV